MWCVRCDVWCGETWCGWCGKRGGVKTPELASFSIKFPSITCRGNESKPLVRTLPSRACPGTFRLHVSKMGNAWSTNTCTCTFGFKKKNDSLCRSAGRWFEKYSYRYVELVNNLWNLSKAKPRTSQVLKVNVSTHYSAPSKGTTPSAKVATTAPYWFNVNKSKASRYQLPGGNKSNNTHHAYREHATNGLGIAAFKACPTQNRYCTKAVWAAKARLETELQIYNHFFG